MSGVLRGLMITSILVSAGFGLSAFLGLFSFEKLVFVNVWMLSVPHTLSTFFRQDQRTPGRGLSALLVIALLLALCRMIEARFEIGALVVLYFFAQQFHYSRQSYGLSRLGHPRAPADSAEVLYYPAVAFLSVLGALSKGPIHFFGYAVRNPLPGSLPEWLTILLLALATLGFMASTRRSRWPHAFLHLALNSALFFGSRNFTLIWFAINVLHNFQYLRLMVKLEGSLRILLFPYLFSFFLALVADRPEMLLFFLALNFAHYLWDSRIWRGVRVD
jgi:hypothetical protein